MKNKPQINTRNYGKGFSGKRVLIQRLPPRSHKTPRAQCPYNPQNTEDTGSERFRGSLKVQTTLPHHSGALALDPPNIVPPEVTLWGPISPQPGFQGLRRDADPRLWGLAGGHQCSRDHLLGRRSEQAGQGGARQPGSCPRSLTATRQPP